MKFRRLLNVKSGFVRSVNVAEGSEKWARVERRFDVQDKGLVRTLETEHQRQNTQNSGNSEWECFKLVLTTNAEANMSQPAEECFGGTSLMGVRLLV